MLCLFISHRQNFLYVMQFEITVFVKPEKGHLRTLLRTQWKRNIIQLKPEGNYEAYGENGNNFRHILERRFLNSCFVKCAFHSQSFTFLLIEYWGIRFGKNANRGLLYWKRKYTQKNWKEAFCETAFEKICLFISHR